MIRTKLLFAQRCQLHVLFTGRNLNNNNNYKALKVLSMLMNA